VTPSRFGVAGVDARSAALKLVCSALVLSVGLVVAGCSKSSKPTTTEAWADGLCSAITTWQGSISSAADSIKAGNVSKSALQSSAGNVKSATDTFASSVKKLGKPPTKAGAQAQQSVEALSGQLQDSAESIQTTVSGASGLTGVLGAVTSVSATLLTVGNDVRTTYNSLQQLDPSGELKTAFNQAPACKSLTQSSG
jgi:hypothetical protein